MNPKQTKIFLSVLAGILTVWLLSPLAGFRQPPISLSKTPLRFDASRAQRVIKEFSVQCPNRVFGSFESRHATGFLRDSLLNLGYELDYMQFSGYVNRTKQVGRNVLGYRAGEDPGIVAVIAHYDTAATTVQGAMDNGSGVGVLIEIARILSKNPTRQSILIVFTDAEEWGMLGALDLATRYPGRDRITAVISLDYVAIGKLGALEIEETGLLRGFTPPWYRMLAAQAAKESGLRVISPTGIREHLERTLYIPWSDQGPFLAAGIAAVNLGSRSVDRTGELAAYHSPLDTFDKLEVPAIEKFGLTAERIIRTLDDRRPAPEEPVNSFCVLDNLFLGPNIILILHCILFLPLPLCLFFYIRNHSGALHASAVIRELIAWLATLLPLLVYYLSIGLFRKLNVLPIYELYPATAKDPVLHNPGWGILAGVWGAAVIIAALCILLFLLAYRKHTQQNFAASKTVLLCLMLVTAAAALLHNSYWAATFLAVPCWFLCLVPCGQNWRKRLLHWIWIAAAALPCCIVFWVFASRFDTGLNFAWYHILALGSGLFSPTGFILGASVTASGIRSAVIQLYTVRENHLNSTASEG